MKFNKIVSVDNTGIDEFVHDDLQSFCEELIMYKDFPKDEEEVVERAKNAEAILVSWNTPITANIIKRLPQLKYIGMCCSLYDESSSNVDIIQAKKQGIVVKGVMNYGDDGVVEYIFSELIRLFKGIGNIQFREEQIELKEIKLGIIGLGTVGNMVADTAKFFEMDVYYHNRRKREDTKYTYLSLKEILNSCDIISTHLPRNSVVMGEEEFKELGNGKILINTGLSPSFDEHAFEKWIKCKSNFAIFDGVSANESFREKYKDYSNIIMTSVVTGFTKNARKRLAHKAVDNLRLFLSEM